MMDIDIIRSLPAPASLSSILPVDPQFEQILDAAFQNPVIVEKICSFTNSGKDLLSLRLMNTLFQTDATKCFKPIHSPIVLNKEISILEFLECMENRIKLKFFPDFPFSGFDVCLNIRPEILLKFATVIGQHVRRYAFSSSSIDQQMTVEMRNLGLLLTHSPQLEEIKVSSFCALSLSDESLAWFPVTFQKLRSIDVTYQEKSDPTRNLHSQRIPLFDVLVTRSTKLDFVRLPTWRVSAPDIYIPDFRPIRVLFETHPNIPRVGFDHEVTINPSSLLWLHKLIEANFRFTEISIKLMYQMGNGQSFSQEQIQSMADKVNEWLATQLDTLVNLSLTFCFPQSVAFRVPAIPGLTYLALKFHPEHELPPNPNPNPIEPLTPNQFPCLQSLTLQNYREDYNIFSSSPLPSIQQLNIEAERPPFINPSWLATFPNVTALRIELLCDGQGPVESSVAFILNHFTRLIHFDLQFITSQGWPFRSAIRYIPDLWEILTGGAPRPLTGHDVWNPNIRHVAVPEPVNGIYELPSLGNLKALKTLRFRPGIGSNLDAILFMTSTGGLVPLEKLSLDLIQNDIPIPTFEMLIYQNRLKGTHKEVIFQSY